jgi:hypothetical protein
MERAWQNFLNQLSSVDLEFTYDDVCGWNAADYAALCDIGLISESGQATGVMCNCADAHWEQVQWSEDGKTPFIPCRNGVPVNVDPIRLRLWRAHLGRLTAHLARSLSLTGEIRSLPANRHWFLGRRRIAGKNPYFFFSAISPQEVPYAINEIRAAYGRVTGVLLVPFAPVEDADDSKMTLIDVTLATSLEGREITGDIEFIEEQFTDERRSLKTQAAAKKPAGALRTHRRSILKAVMTERVLDGMDALAWHLGVSETALHGMVRGDKSRYAPDKLTAVLAKIGCSEAKWNRVPKSAARK